jgi:hypothetical protein
MGLKPTLERYRENVKTDIESMKRDLCDLQAEDSKYRFFSVKLFVVVWAKAECLILFFLLTF